jgi:cytochrome P450
MTATRGDVYYDPYDPEIYRNPYPALARLREEAPLYYNDAYDFYAVSRYADVEEAYRNKETFISSRGDMLEMIKSDLELPRGSLIFEDPPIHTAHRGLMSRVFTPKKMLALVPKMREYCASCLDPLIGVDGFDFIADLAAEMPMKVIGMLMGIPESDQAKVRDYAEANLVVEPGHAVEYSEDYFTGEQMFAEYIDWRKEHPSHDLMTELLNAEFIDETGATRTLTRAEVLTYINIVASAANETTMRLIGWTGQLLGDHPDQRRKVAADLSLVPSAIEEILRFEPPGFQNARYVNRDVELYGQTVPEGSAMLLMIPAANRDPRRFDHPDTFDITRPVTSHLSFGYGTHFCLGASLARAEGRVALEEVLKRFPDWEVNHDAAKLVTTTVVRGWETLPVSVG